MTEFNRNFSGGRMNKDSDERYVPNGEFTHAENIRVSSSDVTGTAQGVASEVGNEGVIQNVQGNEQMTSIKVLDRVISDDAICIGSYSDEESETLYWFVHDPMFNWQGATKADLVLSYNAKTGTLVYHLVTTNKGGLDNNTTLNFNPDYTITGINLVDGLLFWTDDYNQPMKININRTYPAPLVDFTNQLRLDEVLVIKKYPVTSPKITSTKTNTQDKFLEERFISFAYRYKYIDGEYSATSQFSEPAFEPNVFSFSYETYLNEGMVNRFNNCTIEVETGNDLVVGIDLLFKDMNTGIIKVIESLDKDLRGIADDTLFEYTFSNSKIFTILPDSEILRLYDNVPRRAKAQTMMGNRLFYGNYVEGYDMIDSSGNEVNMDYEIELLSESAQSKNIVGDNTDLYVYNIFGTTETTVGGGARIDFSDTNLKQGASITFNVSLVHDHYQGDQPFPTETIASTDISFTYVLQQDYNNISELLNDSDFNQKVGVGTRLPVYHATDPTSCQGATFSDIFACAMPDTLDSMEKVDMMISDVQSIDYIMIGFPSVNVMQVQFPSVIYNDDPDAPTTRAYALLRVSAMNVVFVETTNPRSLHSDVGYEVGIVYLDEYGRPTTAQVSPTNTKAIPCYLSHKKNTLRAIIPPNQRPPAWSERYKFVIKPDKENYHTIFSPLYFTDVSTNDKWFLLEGENSQKIEKGDRLRVKRDAEGHMTKCIFTSVLGKEVQPADFLTVAPTDINGNEIKVPQGVYMKLKANNFNAEIDPSDYSYYGGGCTTAKKAPEFPYHTFSVNDFDADAGAYVDTPVPVGSRVTLDFEWEREGGGCFFGCEERTMSLKVEVFSTQSYTNLYDFFVGEITDPILNTGTSHADCDSQLPTARFLTTLLDISDNGNAATAENIFQFKRDSINNHLVLTVSGTIACGNGLFKKNRSKVCGSVQVLRSDGVIVFETEMQDALPDIWYESSDSYPITDGFHEGNVQDQTGSLSAIIDLAFFNCYAFGNGVESYKIRDSIKGKPLALGNRVTSTSSKEFKEADRFADLTYSGVINDETNVNKLNEFNTGLLNFKPLEESFGSVQILSARQTDILILQTDKISYIQAGKNILSDAVGGGVVASVPDVLGTQIARTENYGISDNPESFVSWGYNKFFTDRKRGVVIQLSGSSASNEQLNVISDMGMSSWFRDTYDTMSESIDVGGYDPFVGEYVLSVGSRQRDSSKPCIACGVARTMTFNATPFDNNRTTSYTENICLGAEVGSVTLQVSVTQDELGNGLECYIVYDGITHSLPTVMEGNSASITFNKNKVDVTEAKVVFTGTYIINRSITFDWNVLCPQVTELTIVRVTLNNPDDAYESIVNQYSWESGSYISPVRTEQVTFAAGDSAPIVSKYEVYQGNQGASFVPVDGAQVTMKALRNATGSSYVPQELDTLRALRSDIEFPNSSVGIASLLVASSEVARTDITTGVLEGSFNLPSTGEYLYLIYDYTH